MLAGSLIKLVYFSRNSECPMDDKEEKSSNKSLLVPSVEKNYPVFEGSLHFAKFETSKINDCLEFIQRNQLHLNGK